MAKHYIRDARRVTDATNAQEGCMPHFSVLLFHFLRVCGFEWLWECDGNAGDNPSHIDDGNMEDSGVAAWADVGTPTSKVKVTTPIRQGTQALQITADASGEGVQSNALVSMRNSTQYHITVWARNASGSPWEVWADSGSGAFAKAGDIPSDGVFKAYHFDFTTYTSGTRYVQIRSSAAGTIHVDGIIVFESYFEYLGLHDEGTDGEIDNGDEFTSGSDYTFTTGDIGRYLCVYDAVNPENTGAYEITAVAAGVATLDLRSATGTLTTNTTGNLPFRVVDIDDASVPWSAGMENHIRSVGYGLESPHTSKWRVFFRHNIINGQTGKGINLWAAPVDTEYDYEDGSFLWSGPSDQRYRNDKYGVGQSKGHMWQAGYSVSSANLQRFFLMTDEDFSFLTCVQFDDGGGVHGTFFVGYTGVDTYHPGAMEFDIYAQRNYISIGNMILWTNDANAFGYDGTTFDYEDKAEQTALLQLGKGSSNVGVLDQSGVPNPFSGDEYLFPLISGRGCDNSTPEGGYRVWTCGVYQGRQAMTDMVTLDSEQIIHFRNGLCWEWNGFDLP